ncbi:hypothetical protein EJ08DRAFT_276773 [Tothia fuscella]|uniref:Nuclear pore complex protein Nup85 n=1 Tax=Tothia fuscella TaxID=1048955 RepID=A0A9P4NP01_9PEZI|nr:hypothetical protein EJ08DRAFT_276773 [Tothia fuscella]
MTFAVPDDYSDSSDPPSTPNRRSTRSHPSTTPAGPPPSDRLPSFTPKGPPPPSSAFGSSLFGTTNRPSSQPKPLFSAPSKNANATVSFGETTSRQIPNSSPPAPIELGDDTDEDDDDDEDMFAKEGEDMDDSLANMSPGYNPFAASTASDAFRASRGNKLPTFNTSMGQSTRSTNHNRSEMDFQAYAKGIAAATPSAPLDDPDSLMLQTELRAEQMAEAYKKGHPEAVPDIIYGLSELWRAHGPMEDDGAESEFIGPSDPDANISKANFLASLALTIHNPPTIEQSSNKTSRFRRSPQLGDNVPTPFPKVLLDWMNRYHNPSGPAIDGVLEYKRGYSASPAFWDAIFMSLTRARFDITIQLLQNAKFEVAVEEDGSGAAYNEDQLSNINKVVSQAIRLLETAPGLTSNDWDIRNENWAVFRLRVESTKEALESYVEGGAQRTIDDLKSSRFGRSAKSSTFGRPESKVPFEIYECIKDVYNQLLAGHEDLFKSSFDWVEAVFALTIWWNGDDGVIPRGNMGASRRSIGRNQQTRQVDVSPGIAYRQQMATAFRLVLDEDDLRDSIDTTDPVQVGLACIFTGDTKGLLGILRTFSVPIASTLAEIAGAGGWLTDETNTRETVENFDQSDLMVLSYGQEDLKTNEKDKLLTEYATLLSQKESIELPANPVEPQPPIEGWELALRVLGRLEDKENAQAKVGALLDRLHFTSNHQVDSVLDLCITLQFPQHAKKITEKYADSVAETTHRYGDALLYYSRAHRFDKAKRVIDELILTCLYTSSAYPPEKDMDDRFRSFVQRPKKSLDNLAKLDLAAAEKLSAWLSGYATLRKFYDIRDERPIENVSDKTSFPLSTKRRKASEALLAVISSSADCIRGGLYDPTVDVVVPVDALLVLLGEALPLLGNSPRTLKLPALYTLLKAVEDLQTIGPRISAKCESVFHIALENFHGGEVPSPRARLRKETSGMSGMTGSSQFSLVGSSLLNSKETMGTVGSGSEGSGVLVGRGEVRREWDWREGLRRNADGEDVLRVLRLGLGREVARAWAEGEDRA